MERIPMTRAGYEKIKAQLAQLEHEEMPALTQRVANARAEGDLSENAEYHATRELQGQLQAKINFLKDKLARAQMMDTSNSPKDEVVFGATVIVMDLDLGEQEEFILVGAGEDDPLNNRILVTSPLAQGLLGRKVGDRVVIPVPAGEINFEIIEIRF